MIVQAEFREPEAAAAAVQGLAAAGFDKNDVEIFSTKPIEFEPGVLDRPSRMSLFAVLGAILNGGLATAFMFYTQQDYPLITGGMPLSSMWATGVITFELTMAGAIAGTVLLFLWEARLLRGKHRTAPQLRDDVIVLQLPCPEAWADRAIQVLQRAGADSAERREEAG